MCASRISTFALACIVALTFTPARSEPITVRYEGSLDTVHPLLSSTFYVGDTIRADITYELLTPDGDPSLNFGDYQDAILSLDLRVGSYSVTAQGGWIEVCNDLNDPPTIPPYDCLQYQSRRTHGLAGLPIGQLTPIAFVVNLDTDTDLNVLSSDELPAQAFNSGDFPSIFRTTMNLTFCDAQNSCGFLLAHEFSGIVLTPVVLMNELIERVLALNLSNGIANSLDAKLDAVVRALDGINDKNDLVAINALRAFISEVEAQRDKFISVEDADEMTAMAQVIISDL